MSRRNTAGSAAVLKAKKERKYGLKRQQQTEINRKRKQLKHLKRNPNDENLRKKIAPSGGY